MADTSLADGNNTAPIIGSIVTIVAAAAGLLRFSNRIDKAETRAVEAEEKVEKVEAALGRLADEVRALRVDHERIGREKLPSLTEHEIHNRIEGTVAQVVRRLEEDVRRLQAAAERGEANRNDMAVALARIAGLLEGLDRGAGGVRGAR